MSPECVAPAACDRTRLTGWLDRHDCVVEQQVLIRSGFEPAYEIEIDPEFAPDGEWSCPVFAFDRVGRLVDDFVSRWGTPIVVRVRPGTAAEWVGQFPAGGLVGVDGVFACPAPTQMCVVVDGLAFLVDVGAPAQTLAVHDQVRQVVPVVGAPLLLLVSYVDIVAIGPEGIAWRSPRLALDGLRVLDACADGIRCEEATMEDSPENFVVSPTTGER